MIGKEVEKSRSKRFLAERKDNNNNNNNKYIMSATRKYSKRGTVTGLKNICPYVFVFFLKFFFCSFWTFTVVGEITTSGRYSRLRFVIRSLKFSNRNIYVSSDRGDFPRCNRPAGALTILLRNIDRNCIDRCYLRYEYMLIKSEKLEEKTFLSGISATRYFTKKKKYSRKR